jgi:hypothetical protein
MEVWIESAARHLAALGSESGPEASEDLEISLALLYSGNQIIDDTLRATDGERGVGENFGEYYFRLRDHLTAISDISDVRVRDVFVRGAFNWDSPFAIDIAERYGEEVSSTILERAASDIWAVRFSATPMLGTLLEFGAELSVDTTAVIRQRIIDNTMDPHIGVRIAAVNALGRIGTASDVSILMEIAERDLTGSASRPGVYPVSNAALKALDAIAQRLGDVNE